MTLQLKANVKGKGEVEGIIASAVGITNEEMSGGAVEGTTVIRTGGSDDVNRTSNSTDL